MDGPARDPLDDLTISAFPGMVVRKDLVKAVKGNALVPTYVLEYLLAQYAATDDPATIRSGIEDVRRILRDHYIHRGDARLVQSTIREKGRHRVIDKVSVALNAKTDVYEAEFSNLGISQVPVSPDIVKAREKLLTGGVWCLCELAYAHSGDPKSIPWFLLSLKPIQLSHLDLAAYTTQRALFTTEQWIDLLIRSIGFEPSLFGTRTKLLQLTRLIPFVERNDNLIELGPKGTGKSHIYSEFSPHGMLISGGEVTVAKLFVNNANRQIGLVGYWDTVAFDEFAGRKKRVDRALVDILKNYMANKSFSRGVETLGAEASLVFIGNTSHSVPYMLKNSDLFDELPEQYHDPAFLDRIHCYLPGWEFEQIRSEMFTDHYGFVVDYLAEVLKAMRDIDYSDRYQQWFTLSPDLSTRDRDGVLKTFSGLMKLIHPSGDAPREDVEALLRIAMEGRKRVKDQLVRIDSTMAPVRFRYSDPAGAWTPVTTVEEDEYPDLYHRVPIDEGDSPAEDTVSSSRDHGARPAAPPSSRTPGHPAAPSPAEPDRAPSLSEGIQRFAEGRHGFSYDRYLGPYLIGATNVRVVDPYIRARHQMRNLVEFLETIAKAATAGAEVHVHLTTKPDDSEEYRGRQRADLETICANAAVAGIDFDYDFSSTLHDRSIHANTGWTIILGRGLDVFQPFDTDWLDLRLRQQRYRAVKEFTLTYVRDGEESGVGE
jgi:ATP-dependent Lon protease